VNVFGIVVLMQEGAVSNGAMSNNVYLVRTVCFFNGSRNFEQNSYRKDVGWSSEMQTARRHIFSLHVSLRSASLCDLQHPPATSVLL